VGFERGKEARGGRSFCVGERGELARGGVVSAAEIDIGGGGGLRDAIGCAGSGREEEEGAGPIVKCGPEDVEGEEWFIWLLRRCR
jgi:hypothetical protein